jgi:hypothetical protein
MRKLLSVLAAGGLDLSMVGSAQAELLPYSGTLQLQLGTLPALTVMNTGNATLNGSGGGLHLSTLAVSHGGMHGTATLPLTDPASPTLVSLVGTFGLQSGTVTISSPTPSAGPQGGGVLPVGGLFRLCIIQGPGCPFSIAIPLTENGTRGNGIGGLITISGFAAGGIKISITGNPWTAGTAVVTGIPTDNGGFTTSSVFGFAHGPASGHSSTAQASGVVQLVTPVIVQTNLASNPLIALFGILTIHFTPEPGTLLLFGSGIAALGVAARRRTN